MNKVKSLRIGAGMSQEELAERSGLSLRTIQRIENGETHPRGHSLRRLCQALGVTMEALQEDDLEHLKEGGRKNFLILLHLSALAFLVPLPGLGVLAPLVLWLLYRDKIEAVEAMGRRILNFQMTWLLVMGLLYAFILFSSLYHLGFPVAPVHIWLLMRVLDAYNICMIALGAILANKQKTIHYRMSIPFITGPAPV
jgi:transcriptional regulator with XRE-family HTH domain